MYLVLTTEYQQESSVCRIYKITEDAHFDEFCDTLEADIRRSGEGYWSTEPFNIREACERIYDDVTRELHDSGSRLFDSIVINGSQEVNPEWDFRITLLHTMAEI